jgi:guanylate kinase
MISSATLYIISAPSGAGKTSLVRALDEQNSAIRISVSHTTRAIRPGEIDGVHYNFVDQAHFQKLIDRGDLLEYANVFGSYYGTSRHWVQEALAYDLDVILEIDWQGRDQVCALFSDAVSIFIVPPSREVLEQRLADRRQDDMQTIQKRMQVVKAELSHYDSSDYLIINDQFDHALYELQQIVLARRLRTAAQVKKHRLLLGQLLSNT